jgi:hypothetical protein
MRNNIGFWATLILSTLYTLAENTLFNVIGSVFFLISAGVYFYLDVKSEIVKE